MTVLPRDCLLSSETTASVPAHIPIFHNQLRDLLVCPQERGVVAYISGRLVVSHDIRGSYKSPKLLAHLDFEPNCLASGAGLIVAGGGNGELYIGALADSSQSSLVPSSGPSCSSPQIQWSHTTKLSTASINNSLLITRNDLTPSGPLPDLTKGHPRLFVSNNDESIKVFNISVSGATQGRMVPAGSIRVGTPVNHTSISPDGKTLLAVGDTNDVFLYNLVAGDSVEFNRISKYRAGSDANFSTAWSSDGRKFAVACQDGSVTVWDTRSSKTLALFRCGKQHPDYHSLTGGGRGHFINAYYPPARGSATTYTTRLMTRPASAAVAGITASPGSRLDGSIVSRYLAERSPYPASYNDLLNRTEPDRRGSPNLESIAARNRNRWEGSERSSAAPPRPDSTDRRPDGESWAHVPTLRHIPSGAANNADLQEGARQNASEPPSNSTMLPYYPSSQFYSSIPDREFLPLPPREIVMSWPERHRTSIMHGDPGRGMGSWMEQRVDGPASTPGLSMEERNPARVLKFSPASGTRDVLVFTEDSTRFHVIDAQSFENHCVVTVPKASSGSDAPSSSRRNFNQIWPNLSTTHRYDSDEDMENAEEVPMSRPAQQPSASSSWPSRGPALSALPDGTPNLAGLAFDPTGGSLYVGSDTGIFEWELDSESRKWDRGYVSWA